MKQDFVTDETGGISIETNIVLPFILAIAAFAAYAGFNAAKRGINFIGIKIMGEQTIAEIDFSGNLDDWNFLNQHNKSEILTDNSMKNKVGPSYLNLRPGTIEYPMDGLIPGMTYEVTFLAESEAKGNNKTVDFAFAVGDTVMGETRFKGNHDFRTMSYTFVEGIALDQIT